MAQGIGRLRTIGIAAQPTFGTAATVSQYVLPLLNSPTFEPIINKIQNNAALGSSYMTNEIENGSRQVSVPLEFKIDERHAPLLFQQKFEITSVTASGETSVWEHTLEYTNSTNIWYTLFFQDDQRQDYSISNVLFNNLDFTFDQDFVRVNSTAQGSYPVTATIANTVVQPNEFVGRMVAFKIADDGVATTATNVLSVESNLAFGTNSEDTRFALGNEDLVVHEATADEFNFTVNALQANRDFYDDFTDNTGKQFDVVVESTDRFVSGSSNNTRPKIEFNIPYAKLTEFSDNSELDDLVQQSFTLKALDKVGEINAPMRIVVVNNVASY